MVLIERRGRTLPFELFKEGATMNRMATRLCNASFATLLGLIASSAFAQSPAEFIDEASAKGIADIEASRLAHQKSESKECEWSQGWRMGCAGVNLKSLWSRAESPHCLVNRPSATPR